MRLLSVVKTSISRSAVVGLVFLLAAAEHGLTQSLSDFSALQKHINKDVTVETQDGQVPGKLIRVEENRLIVYYAGAPKAIAREAVKRVTRHHSRHTAAWVAGTAGAGAALGLLAGMSRFDDSTNANGKIAALTGVWGGVGALGGYGLSRIGNKEELVYAVE
jgi:hypothetical protein